MTRRILLAAVTRDAAVILGEGDRLGTLEAGKDADLVLWKEQPSCLGQTQRVIVDGVTRFQR